MEEALAADDNSSQQSYVRDFSPEDPKQVQQLIEKVTRGVSRLGIVPLCDREDLVQTLLLEAIRTRKVVTWIWIKRRCLDSLRDGATRTRHEEAAVTRAVGGMEAPVPAGAQGAGETLDRLMREAPLTREQRQMLLEKFYQGRTKEQTALSMGVSRGYVDRQIAYALELLRQVALEEGEDNE